MSDAATERKLNSYLTQENEVLIERVRLLELAVEREREACAKVAEEYGEHFDQIASQHDDCEMGQASAGKHIAALIRGRG